MNIKKSLNKIVLTWLLLVSNMYSEAIAQSLDSMWWPEKKTHIQKKSKTTINPTGSVYLHTWLPLSNTTDPYEPLRTPAPGFALNIDIKTQLHPNLTLEHTIWWGMGSMPNTLLWPTRFHPTLPRNYGHTSISYHNKSLKITTSSWIIKPAYGHDDGNSPHSNLSWRTLLATVATPCAFVAPLYLAATYSTDLSSHDIFIALTGWWNGTAWYQLWGSGTKWWYTYKYDTSNKDTSWKIRVWWSTNKDKNENLNYDETNHLSIWWEYRYKNIITQWHLDYIKTSNIAIPQWLIIWGHINYTLPLQQTAYTLKWWFWWEITQWKNLPPYKYGVDVTLESNNKTWITLNYIITHTQQYIITMYKQF